MKKIDNKPHKHRWLLIIAIPAGLIFAWCLFLYLAMTIPGDTKPILAEANKLQVGTGWKLESEQVVPPYLIYLNGGASPSVMRVWRLPKSMNESEFKQLIRDSGWPEFEGECQGQNSSNGPDDWWPVCMYEQVSGSYRITVNLRSNLNKEGQIWQYIQKK